MTSLPDPLLHRHPDHPIQPLLLRRWSPRAMRPEPLSHAELDRLLEAARWAPSSFNEQPWRFRYAHRASVHWEGFFALLSAPNQVWCRNAGVLVVVAARTTFTHNGKPNAVFAFDAGAATQNLALQGAAMGLVVHAMAGFDRERARGHLHLPTDHAALAMVAIGHPGELEQLPADLRSREVPSGRRPIAEFAGEGPLPA